MTKDVKFIWIDKQENTFTSLKDKLYTTHILTLSNFEKKFELEYDALGIDIGVVLMQEGCLIAYFNEKLNKISLNYSTYDKEPYTLAF